MVACHCPELYYIHITLYYMALSQISSYKAEDMKYRILVGSMKIYHRYRHKQYRDMNVNHINKTQRVRYGYIKEAYRYMAYYSVT